MTQNRPWSVWWDFSWEIDETGPSHIIVQTDHPQYLHTPYIYKFPISECEDDNGHVDKWVETWYHKFEKDVTSGVVSIHTLMKSLGFSKEIK
jgi:hypothetical protein